MLGEEPPSSMGKKIHILTFASDNYIRAARLQNLTARALGFKHTLYTKRDLPHEILEFSLSHTRGFGFWMWKSYLIERTLQSSHLDDIYWWLDASILPTKALKVVEFTNIYLSENIFSNPIEWSKPISSDLLSEYGVFLRDGFIPDASYIGIKPTSCTKNIISFWSKLCSNPSFINDDLHGMIPSPRFRDHRHDQSMLGYASYVFKLTPSPSITQFGLGPLCLLHHRKSANSLVSYLYILLLSLLALLSRFSRLRQGKMVRLPKSLLYSKPIVNASAK